MRFGCPFAIGVWHASGTWNVDDKVARDNENVVTYIFVLLQPPSQANANYFSTIVWKYHNMTPKRSLKSHPNDPESNGQSIAYE